MSNAVGKDIRGIMSLPRVTWTATVDCIFDAIHTLQFRTRMVTGVFWGQCLEREMELAIKDKHEKYILVMDYDSIFDTKDIIKLWEVMEQDPSIDALCPVQVMRESNNLLYKIDTESKFPKNPDAIDVLSGHFGLTLIRISSLDRLPRPLFLAEPDPNGSWGPYKTDEDIYFWNQMRQYSRRVCVCPRVKIGHLQLMVTWPDGKYAKNQYVNDFKAQGRPGNCEVDG